MVSAVMSRWQNIRIGSQTIFIQLNSACFWFEGIKKIILLKTHWRFIFPQNKCLSFFDAPYFMITFPSLSCCLLDHQFCLLIRIVKTFVKKPDVVVSQEALGGTMTVLEPVAAGYCTGKGECVHCPSVSHCSRWGSSLCIYMVKFPMTTAVRTSSQLRNVHGKTRLRLP